ncbi:MAG: ABC transporter permease [Myxococcota bacterium]
MDRRVFYLFQRDLRRLLHSRALPITLLALPLLLLGLLYLEYGGARGVKLPPVRVIMLNLDNPDGGLVATHESMVLTQGLLDEQLEPFIRTRLAKDEAQVDAALKYRQADVGLVIPAGFAAGVQDPLNPPTLLLRAGKGRAQAVEEVQSVLIPLLERLQVGGNLLTVLQSSAEAQGISLTTANLAEGVKDHTGWEAQREELHRQGKTLGLEVLGPDPSVSISAFEQRSQERMLAMAAVLVLASSLLGGQLALSFRQEQTENTLVRLKLPSVTPLMWVLGKAGAGAVMGWGGLLVVLVISSWFYRLTWTPLSGVLLAWVLTPLAGVGFGLALTPLLGRVSRPGSWLVGSWVLVSLLSGTFGALLGPAGQQMLERFPASLRSLLEGMTFLFPQGWTLRLWQETFGDAALSSRLLSLSGGLVLSLLGLGLGLLGARTLLQRQEGV